MFNPFDMGDWVDSLAEAYLALFGILLVALGQNSLPSIDELRSGWFLLAAGGSLGLAIRVFTALIVAFAVFMVLTPNRQHGKKISQTVTGLLVVFGFGILLFPIYSLALDISDALSQMALNLSLAKEDATSAEVVEKIKQTVLPDNTFGKAITVILSGAFVGTAAIVVGMLQLLTIVALVLYPLVAVTLTTKIGNTLISVFNSSLIVSLAVGPLMTFFYVLPYSLPGAESTLFRFIYTIVSSILAAVVPVVLWVLLFKASSEVFGQVTASLADRIDINSMPAVSVDSIQQNTTEARTSATATFAQSVATGAVGVKLAEGEGDSQQDLMHNLKRVMTDAAAVTATATGHPGIGMLIQTYDTIHNSKKDTTTPPKE